MTAIVHLMLPPFVPDFTIHVDSLEIYMCKLLCRGEWGGGGGGGGGAGRAPG